ncbi:hypothetical protein [Qipengyuania nanhaisediminis]|uniref:hypothetical protein n=1 Tax=Qipengyuania nanhaisediminis TaxID=604088 RepID=UPI0038B23026
MTSRNSTLFAICCPLALALSACAGSSDKYPSLAIRDAERMAGLERPVAPPSPVAAVVAEEAIEAEVSEALGLHQRFTALQPDVSRLVSAANGLGIESNAYARAAAALGELSALRGRTLSVLGGIDRYEAEAATTFAPTAAIESAQARIAGLLREQDAAIDSLSAILAR